MDGVKMVKVDNWSVFFLQKLQSLYTRGDFTDLTLQFHTNECIKVHRLVLNTCTEYFESLIKQNKASNHMRLPPNLQSDVVVPIINFMYSGRLEFRPELHTRLYNTAKILNMQILIKLLETHVSAPVRSSSSSISSPIKHRHIPISSLSTVSSVIAPKPVKLDQEYSDIIPGKRLPIWKKRTTPASSYSVNVTPRTVIDEPAKPTRFEWPEDGDSDTAPLLYSSTFDDISYDSVPIVKSINSIVQSALPPTPSEPLLQLPQQRVMPAATFESVYQSSQLKRDSSKLVNSQSGNAPKKARGENEDAMELSEEQESDKGVMTEGGDPVCDDVLAAASASAGVEDGTDSTACSSLQYHPSVSQSPSTPKPILKVTESPDASKEITSAKKVRFHLEPKVQVQKPSNDSANSEAAVCSIGSSSNKDGAECSADVQSPGQFHAAGSTSKKVVDSGGNMFEIRATTTSVKKSAGGATIQTKVPNVTNHAKIIAEVLKKYPDLVKNNKNIRLKIMQKDGSQAVSVEKSGGSSENKPKVSYMVVKADQGLKTKVQLEQVHPQTGAHNVTGPWICSGCHPNKPIQFESYYLYRKHLQDVHQEKIDVRICEYCGHRASKRNLLLYHLYKIHGIPPPISCHFPKCDECGYVALSEALLAKHKNAHSATTQKEVTCRGCNLSFKNYASLHAHLTSGVLCSQTKQNFKCPVCSKLFQRQINLKNHIRADHKDLKLLEDMGDTNEEEIVEEEEEDDEEDDDGEDQSISAAVPSALPTDEVLHHLPQQEQISHQIIQNQTVMDIQSDVHQGTVSIQQPTTYILPPGVTILTENAQGTLMPSTEAEALSNVASGIAASLGVADSMVVGDQGQHQTLILVDKNQVIQIPGPAGTAGTQVHEYIVPDIMANDMGQLYTSGHLSQLVQYTPSGTLQQPVAVSTDQGLMTITAVNANGSIVSQPSTAPIMEQSLMQIPQGHLTEHNGGEIAMILTDHAYSEGMVRENGTVIQTTAVPVSMSMVPTTAVVTVVPAVSTIPQDRSMIDNGAQHVMQGIIKGEDGSHVSSNTAVVLESPHHPPPQQTQKMAELVSDWDDDENNDEGSVLPRTTDEITEDAALPSRPTIMLKSELEADNLTDDVQVKMA